ncbi:MAG: lipid-binding SYLF domain-containing protein [Alphaproteobacteria bacterium]|nr:lipid-binding SYLF domain-containing protein [Alphaproteobacteria bacterium]
MLRIATVLMALIFAAPFIAPRPALAYSEAQELVDKSVITVQKLLAQPDIAPHLKNYLSHAKGVLIFPNLLKAGFIFGAEGGSGVMLAKGANGKWSYPAFFGMGSASFGLQFGGQASETIIVIMTSKGLSSILEHKIKVGAELNAAIGPLGVGIEGSTSAALGADMITYSVSKGAFLGGALEGAIIEKQDTLNHEYYKSTGAAPSSILIKGKYANSGADRLRSVLAKSR